MYCDEMATANNFSKEIGLPGVAFKSNSQTYLNDPQFFAKIAPYIHLDTIDDLINKCNIVSQYLCEIIENIHGIKAILTIGDVIEDLGSNFNFDQDYVKSLTKRGKKSLQPRNYRHHAWITLESMEIIDFTLPTTKAMTAECEKSIKDKMIGGIIGGHGDQLTGNIQFKPILLGDDFYIKYDSEYINFLSCYKSALATRGPIRATRFEM